MNGPSELATRKALRRRWRRFSAMLNLAPTPMKRDVEDPPIGTDARGGAAPCWAEARRQCPLRPADRRGGSGGRASGLLLVYSTDLPQVTELEHYRPSTITQLYDDQDRVIGQFALQRRVIDSYNDFPKVLRDALISTEDKDFERHWGVDVWRVFGAAWRDILQESRAQGASTLTMQLSRNLFLSPDRNFRRKIQEVMLAIQIERRFTKQQIFTLYANQIYLGHGVYGFEAGANYYFSKKAKDLTLEEAAVLAGLPKAPNAYSPINNPERSLRRRNLVINNMLEDGKITAAEAQRAKSAPLQLNVQAEPNDIAPYFVEEIRQYLEKKYGTQEVHEGGLRVYTSLESGDAARRATGGARRPGRLRAPPRLEGQPAERHRQWRFARHLSPRGLGQRDLAPGSYVHALVTEVEPQAATVKFGHYQARLGPARSKWTRYASPQQFLTRGRSGLREGRGVERQRQPRVAGAGIRSAGRAAGARQLHRRHQGDGRRPRLRAVEVQPRHAGGAAGRARRSSPTSTPPPSTRD